MRFFGLPYPARAFGKGYSYTSTGTPTPPAPLQGDPHTPSAPPTPPAPSLAGYPYTSAGIPHLARTFAGGYPYTSPATPAPPTPSARDTHTLLPAPPPRPRLRRSSPAPTRGRGPCVAISGEQPSRGWSRWATVPGSSPGSPHMLDRGDIAIGGGGPRGGGTCSPSPVSHAPDTLLLASPIPPGLQPAGYPYTSAGLPHPARVGQSDTHDGSGRTVLERTSDTYSRRS